MKKFLIFFLFILITYFCFSNELEYNEKVDLRNKTLGGFISFYAGLGFTAVSVPLMATGISLGYPGLMFAGAALIVPTYIFCIFIGPIIQIYENYLIERDYQKGRLTDFYFHPGFWYGMGWTSFVISLPFLFFGSSYLFEKKAWPKVLFAISMLLLTASFASFGASATIPFARFTF